MEISKKIFFGTKLQALKLEFGLFIVFGLYQIHGKKIYLGEIGCFFLGFFLTMDNASKIVYGINEENDFSAFFVLETFT